MSYPGPIGGDLLARRYRLIDRVGAGGMSVVWRARDEVLDRLVAVKWLGAELADDDLFRDLVRREAWATAQIKHPAVATVYDYGEVRAQDGQSLAYVVMEMLDGQSLSDRLRRGPIPWREAVGICAEVADALATAHGHGVVHRDISPDNVMLTSSGLRVFDFGIAAPVGEPDDDATGSTFGTPAYVAPERLDGQPAQTATDVYSLGVMLFESLTGQPPFPEDTWDPQAPLRFRAAPRLRGVPGLPAAVGRLCQRCLAHDPADRPPAREVADQLAAYGRPWWRGRALIGVAAAIVALVAVAVALADWGRSGAPSGAAPPGPSAAPVVTPPAGASSGPASTPAGTPPRATSPAPGGSVGPPVVAPPVPPGRTSPVTSPPGGATTAPPPAGVPVQQALDDLRGIIAEGTRDNTIRGDVADDLRNHVDAIAAQLAFSSGQGVRDMISGLRRQVTNRASQPWQPPPTSGPGQQCPASGCTAIHPIARDKLFGAIDVLSASTSS
jgi:serine/threonine-protein kinase